MPLRIRNRRAAAAFLPWSLAMAAVLSGCTSVSLDPAPAAAAGATPEATAAAPVAAPAPAPAVAAVPAARPAVPARIPDDGVVAQFTGTDTALPAQSVALLEAVAADRTQKTWRWEIKGYSQRSAQPNARETALARAWAVRKVLVERGVPPQQIKVLYSTEQAREAVTLLPQRPAAAVPPAPVAPAAAPAPAQPPRKAAPSRPAPAPAAKAPVKKAVAAHKPKAKPAAPSHKTAAAHKPGVPHPKKTAKVAGHSVGAQTGR